MKGHYNKGGDDLKWLSGSKLDSDGHLSLPRLEAAWANPGQATGRQRPIGVPDAAEVLGEATKATMKAVRRLDKIAAGAPDPAGVADDVARSAADLLRKTAAIFEPATKPGPLTYAAWAYRPGAATAEGDSYSEQPGGGGPQPGGHRPRHAHCA